MFNLITRLDNWPYLPQAEQCVESPQKYPGKIPLLEELHQEPLVACSQVALLGKPMKLFSDVSTNQY